MCGSKSRTWLYIWSSRRNLIFKHILDEEVLGDTLGLAQRDNLVQLEHTFIILESEVKLPSEVDIHICILYLWTDLGKPNYKQK